MPVRKIPRTYRSVRGQFPSMINGRSIGFESTLERDFYLSLEFDRTVESYEEQPIQITEIVDGKEVQYTPDCLVTYNDGKPQLLAEIKSAEELEKATPGLQHRLAMGRTHAEAKGMRFQIFTEADIRTASLETYRFLYGFSRPPRDLVSRKEPIIAIVTEADEISLAHLLERLSPDRTVRATFTPVIWHLLFTGELVADLNQQIGYSTILRTDHGHHLP